MSYDFGSPTGPFTITNSGVIKSNGSDAIHAEFGALTVTNKAGGEITSLTGAAIVGAAYNPIVVYNNGVINGAIDLSDA